VGVLERVIQRAASVVPAAAMVSVTLHEANGQVHTPVETDPLAARADEIHYRTGEGPCLEATATSSSGFTSSLDLAHDPRYPRFGPQVAELGMNAVCATELFTGGDPPRLGALNYYFRDAAAAADVYRDAMLLLAAHAAVGLHAARNLAAEQLRTSVELHHFRRAPLAPPDPAGPRPVPGRGSGSRPTGRDHAGHRRRGGGPRGTGPGRPGGRSVRTGYPTVRRGTDPLRWFSGRLSAGGAVS
jgi:hypothetical protein